MKGDREQRDLLLAHFYELHQYHYDAVQYYDKLVRENPKNSFYQEKREIHRFFLGK